MRISFPLKDQDITLRAPHPRPIRVRLRGDAVTGMDNHGARLTFFPPLVTPADRWVMVIKNEMAPRQGGKNLRLTFSKRMQGPFETTLSRPVVRAGTEIVDTMGEGPSLLKRGGLWYLYWDAPGSKFSYCLATSRDLTTWTNRSPEMSLPARRMRHGTVLVVPEAAVAQALTDND